MPAFAEKVEMKTFKTVLSGTQVHTHYRIHFNNDGTLTLNITDGSQPLVIENIKKVSDRRPMDGCLQLELTEDIKLFECAHDGPTSWRLNVKGDDINLQMETKGRIQIK